MREREVLLKWLEKPCRWMMGYLGFEGWRRDAFRFLCGSAVGTMGTTLHLYVVGSRGADFLFWGEAFQLSMLGMAVVSFPVFVPKRTRRSMRMS